MSDFMTTAIAVLIVILMFVIPIAIAVIIILLIVKAVKKSNNNNVTNYYTPPANVNYQQIQCKPQQNYQNVQSAIPQNTYNYRPQPNYIPPVNHRYVPPQHTNQNYNQNYPYQATSLLTEREYGFFRVLKVIANRNNMDVLIKVRLADLVKVSESVPTNEFYKYFNKISSKHIDFLLIDGIKVVTLIELDDNTHNRKDRIERDNFVNETVTKCGYRIIHTYGDTKQIEDAIIQYRNPIRNTIG